MKSVLIALLCGLLFAASFASKNQACYDDCNKEHIKCVGDCVNNGNNSFKCLWECRNNYYACTAGCYQPPSP